jgi:predicted aconitase with swiveling domain
MNVNAMNRTTTTTSSLILLAAKAGAAAGLVAALLAGHVAEPVIIVGVIVAASLIGWHRTQFVPARVHSEHRFTVVSRSGDGFVTIDSSGARHVARRLVLGGPPS